MDGSEAKTHSREITVLLVEDDVIDCEYFSRILRSSHDVLLQTARCINDSVQLIRQAPFDAVFFDLGLPDSYGIDTVKRMVEEFPRVPLVVLTGMADEELERDALSLGVSGYLVKGQATADQVSATLENALSSAHDA